MSEEPYLGPLHDVGVLFVHGIGQSKEGDTLARFGESLRTAVAARAAPAGNAAAASVAIDAAWLATPGEGNPCRAELTIDNVRSQRTGPRAPASMNSRWLLAEAWWAAQFPPPGFSDVAFWATSVLPGTLLAHMDRRLRRAGYAVAERLRSISPVRGLLAIPRWVAEWAYVLLALAGLPLLIAAVMLLILAGLLPPPLNRLASGLQRMLSATVGDSYAFKQNRIKGAAIRRTVLERLEWLAARCRKVVVVAHSQGAAIAHEALRQPLTAPCDVFISCGSGLQKLTEIERDVQDAGGARPKLWAAALGAVVASASLLTLLLHPWGTTAVVGIDALGAAVGLGIFYVLALLVTAELSFEVFQAPAKRPGAARTLPWNAYAGLLVGLPGVATLWLHRGHAAAAAQLGALALALTFGLLMLHGGYRAWQRARGRFQRPMEQWQRDQEDYRRYYELTNRQQMRWMDFYTRYDPVPNGALMDFLSPPQDDGPARSQELTLESYEVHNLGSAILDHTTYFHARDDFMQRVARTLLRTAGIGARPVNAGRAATGRAATRRGWRVDVLRWARRGVLLAAVVLAAGVLLREGAWTAERNFDWQSAAGGWLELALVRLETWGRNALYVGASAWLAGTALTLSAWSWWSAHELGLFHANADYAPLPGRMACTIAIPLGLLVAASWWTLGWPGALAVLLLALAAAGVLHRSERVRAFVRMRSRSGDAKSLRDLDAIDMKRKLERALKQRHWREVTENAAPLADRGDRAAAIALRKAVKQGYAPAARELGWLYQSRANRAQGERRRHNLRASLLAYQKGARRDAWCARNAAYLLQERYRHGKARSDRAGALQCFRRAVKLGDAASCHNIALLLDQPKNANTRRRYLERGIERSDALSAWWLADDLRAEARRGSPHAPVAEMSSRYYLKALEWGIPNPASDAGDMYLEAGDIPAARRAYSLGARLRSAKAALGLAELEEKHAGDLPAATLAFRWALQLDAGRPAAALYGLGRVHRAQAHAQAARRFFKEALEAGEDQLEAAQAGVELAGLLQKPGDKDNDEAKAALLAACKLLPRVAIDAYVALVVKTEDIRSARAIPDEWREPMSADSRAMLARMLRFEDQPKALADAAAALEHWSLAPERAAGLLDLFHGDDAAALLAIVARRDVWYREQLAAALEAHSPHRAEILRQSTSADA
jgi:hypothetical protein